MRKLVLVSLVFFLMLALSAVEAQAQSCYDRAPTGGTMWTWWNLTSGYTYTVTVTNLSSSGTVYLEVWEYCWKDVWGKWWCRGLVSRSGPWTGWASIWFRATRSEYFVWVVAPWSRHRICFR